MKLTLQDIVKNSVIAEIVPATIEFKLKGKTETVDIYVKLMSYEESEAMWKRLGAGEDILPDRLAKSLVDQSGNELFTPEIIKTKFNQSLVVACNNKIHELNHGETEVDDEGKSSGSSPQMMKSGLNSLATESADEPLPVQSET